MSAELAGYAAAWRSAADDFVALCDQVPEDAWDTPTALPGWDCHACLAHTAHLEGLLAGARHDDVEVGDAPHARGPMGTFTEQGVVARRDRPSVEVIAELRSAVAGRAERLTDTPPDDPDAPAPGLFGAIGWSTRTLFRNRPLDLWMHEQDIREAVGLPGGLDTPAARHTTDYLLEAMPMVLAKRAGAPAGTTLVVEVAGHGVRSWRVRDDGRGEAVEPPADPTVALTMDRETFTRLAGGRRTAQEASVTIHGDHALATKILEAMAVTP